MLPPIWPLSNMRNDLFEAPTKVVNGDNSVENVLGRFEHADRLSNCIGVDYVPPASPSGLIQIPQLLNLSMPKPPPGPQQNITVCHAYLVWGHLSDLSALIWILELRVLTVIDCPKILGAK